jgi:hypothetical protein
MLVGKILVSGYCLFEISVMFYVVQFCVLVKLCAVIWFLLCIFCGQLGFVNEFYIMGVTLCLGFSSCFSFSMISQKCAPFSVLLIFGYLF